MSRIKQENILRPAKGPLLDRAIKLNEATVQGPVRIHVDKELVAVKALPSVSVSAHYMQVAYQCTRACARMHKRACSLAQYPLLKHLHETLRVQHTLRRRRADEPLVHNRVC